MRHGPLGMWPEQYHHHFLADRATMSEPSFQQSPPAGRMKVLFVAEAVTLAHVGRPITLAQGLDPALYDVHFACAPGYDFCFTDCAFTRWEINSIPSQQFLDALAQGKPVYDAATLSR